MATIADLNKNEAVDNNVVTDNVLNEQVKALEVPVENQQVAENKVSPAEVYKDDPDKDIDSAQADEQLDTKLDTPPAVTPPAPPTSDAEILFAAVNNLSDASLVAP